MSTVSNVLDEKAEYSSQQIDLREGARVGHGKVVKDIRESDPQLASIFNAKTNILDSLGDPSIVFLTPPSAQHPIFQGQSTYYRGIDHHRSFSRLLLDGYSLVVKGGDVLNQADIALESARIKTKEIPGAGEVAENEKEFTAASTLQKLAIEQLGRTTYTAFPLQVRSIDQIPTSTGDSVHIRTFFNSTDYFKYPNLVKKYLEIPANRGIGDWLLDRHKLTPSEYIYCVKGLDIRANEIAGLLYFPEGKEIYKNDLLFRMKNGSGLSSGLQAYGGRFTEEGRNKQQVIEGIYKVLGDEYEFDPTTIMPSYDIDANYLQALTDLPAACERTGVTSQVLDQFIDRVTEIAALGHGAGYAFSDGEDTGGSLISRNVTFAGSVLDLGTLTPIDREMNLVTKDFNELLITISCMKRLVSHKSDPSLLEKIKTVYAQKLSNVCNDESRRSAVLRAIQNIDETTLEILNYSRT